MGLVEAVGEAALALRGGLLAEQPIQQFRRRGGLALGALELGIEHPGHAVEAQLGQERLEFLRHRRRPRY